jgi:hypothetical protein
MTPATIGTATLARSVTLMTFEYYRLDTTLVDYIFVRDLKINLRNP